jgi:hypothetical protein
LGNKVFYLIKYIVSISASKIYSFGKKRDANIPPVLACLKELISAKLAYINKYEATIDQLYVYQSSLSMNIVR